MRFVSHKNQFSLLKKIAMICNAGKKNKPCPYFLDLCLSDFWILFDHQKWFLAIRLLKVIFNTKASNFMKVFTNFSCKSLMSVKHLELSACKGNTQF